MSASRVAVKFASMKTALLLACIALVGAGASVQAADAMFKVVAPDGRVTYTDRPPSASEGRVMPVNRDSGAAIDTALPFALRAVAARFPVTLYTMTKCGDPCDQGRALLVRRGIPFRERVAETDEERLAWQGLVGGIEAPTLTVGGQSMRGFAPAAWDETLDTAGYPRQSLLPPTFQRPAATALVERAPPPPKPAPAAPRLPEPAPGGIRF